MFHVCICFEVKRNKTLIVGTDDQQSWRNTLKKRKLWKQFNLKPRNNTLRKTNNNNNNNNNKSNNNHNININNDSENNTNNNNIKNSNNSWWVIKNINSTYWSTKVFWGALHLLSRTCHIFVTMKSKHQKLKS